MSDLDDDYSPMVGVPAGLDEDEDPSKPGPSSAAGEYDEENEQHDVEEFLSLFDRRRIAAQATRRGEKDFESHGTRAQEALLETSRQLLEEVLREPRIQTEHAWLRAWYFPSWWANAAAETDEVEIGAPASKEAGKKRGLFVRERVVVADRQNSVMFRNIGRVVPGLAKTDPVFEKVWLLPEEALFLLDRGSMELWWPTKSLEETFPAASREPVAGGLDEYEGGFPLSQEAAYSLLIGDAGERGKVTLEQFQVYANLRRTGYTVLRAPQHYTLPKHSVDDRPRQLKGSSKVGLWQWMVSLVFRTEKPGTLEMYGPLVRPGLYRSYRTIYEKLATIPRHKPDRAVEGHPLTQDPYKVFYFIWKMGRPDFSKSKPPPPDFYVAVVEARKTGMPTLQQISDLLETTPREGAKENASMYAKLKHGHRHVIIAVVDQGVINYYRLAEGAFGEQLIFPRFDNSRTPIRGQKTLRRGGGGGGGGRGGGGVQGRGRGGKRRGR